MNDYKGYTNYNNCDDLLQYICNLKNQRNHLFLMIIGKYCCNCKWKNTDECLGEFDFFENKKPIEQCINKHFMTYGSIVNENL